MRASEPLGRERELGGYEHLGGGKEALVDERGDLLPRNVHLRWASGFRIVVW